MHGEQTEQNPFLNAVHPGSAVQRESKWKKLRLTVNLLSRNLEKKHLFWKKEILSRATESALDIYYSAVYETETAHIKKKKREEQNKISVQFASTVGSLVFFYFIFKVCRFGIFRCFRDVA